MIPLKVRNIVFGEGMPKICVPLVETNLNDLVKEARSVIELPIDLIEWRIDWYEEDIMLALKELRKTIKDIPLIVTFRTKREGGNKDISSDEYQALLIDIAKSREADLIDVEAFSEGNVKELVNSLHGHAKVILSHHNFKMTYDEDEILRRFKEMEALDGDILKMALMPETSEDVMTLMMATLKESMISDKLLITMSMSEKGRMSRILGELFGSVLTFGAAHKTSAPGQIEVNELKVLLESVHKA